MTTVHAVFMARARARKWHGLIGNYHLMNNLNQQITDLLKRSWLSSQSVSELEKINEEFNILIANNPLSKGLLFYYNEFRIAHIDKLPKTRPQILVGGPIGILYPHLHNYPLFEIADVICLTTVHKPLVYYSAIHFQPKTLYFDILKKLPKGFKPDFFWDNQIEHKHFIPYGIEIAPFPIVASVCHTYLHKTLEHVYELFDLIVPVSKSYSHLLKKNFPDKIIDLPFGLNWGAFNYTITPQWEKSLDVCITFNESSSPVYDYKRNRIIELAKKFKAKYGNRFSINISGKVSQTQYIDTLKKSRITINATAVNGPYNYRTIEAMCAGSMVFQYEWDDSFFDNKFSELFIEGRHGVTFNFENFEQKLLYYLENPIQTEKIAREGYEFLIQNYNYKKLYKQLFQEIKNRDIKLPRKISNKNNYYHNDMVYYYQNNEMINFMSLGILTVFEEPWIQFNNLMVFANTLDENSEGYHLLIASLPSSLTQLEAFTTWALCCKFYQEALAQVPKEFAWIVKWNFLLLSIENKQFKKQDLEEMLTALETEPIPFDEKKITFKYYVRSNDFPDYQYKAVEWEFIRLNLELMKAMENPQARALLYRNYALKAVKYFLVKDVAADNNH